MTTVRKEREKKRNFTNTHISVQTAVTSVCLVFYSKVSRCWAVIGGENTEPGVNGSVHVQTAEVPEFSCCSLQRSVFDAQSLVAVAVCTQDQVTVREEAGAHQRHGAAGALEAGLVPLPLLEGDVLSIPEPWDRDTCSVWTTGEGMS